MCEAPPIKNIPRKMFRFRKYEFGQTAIYKDFKIHVEGNSEWWWDVVYKGREIAQSDFAYKTQAKTKKQAIKRAITKLNKWRRENL